LKTFDLSLVCGDKRSSFRTHAICNGSTATNPAFLLKHMGLSGLSDFLRFAVLDIYEGIYVDGDIMFLRDMRVLWDENFFYRWSFTHYVNNGIE
jgi:hypothetical protein